MRAYFLTNMYLSSIQNGIQPAHCLAEMFIKYENHQLRSVIGDWAKNHKTMIVLNGGYSSALREFAFFLNSEAADFCQVPWSHFREGDDALDGALTVVGFILSERLYENIKTESSLEDLVTEQQLLPWEAELVVRLREFSLAR